MSEGKLDPDTDLVLYIYPAKQINGFGLLSEEDRKNFVKMKPCFYYCFSNLNDNENILRLRAESDDSHGHIIAESICKVTGITDRDFHYNSKAKH